MKLQIKVTSMACSACGDTITKALKKLDPNAEVQADPKTKIVTVETIQPEIAVRQAIAAAGYPID